MAQGRPRGHADDYLHPGVFAPTLVLDLLQSPGPVDQGRRLWDILLAHKAKTLVANGHTHAHERYAPMGPMGQPASDRITELAIGPGGAPPASCFTTRRPAPVVADLGAHSRLFTLRSDGTYHIGVKRVPVSGSARLADQFDG